MPYEIQQTTIILSGNLFSSKSFDACWEPRVTDQIYRNIIKYKPNSIVRCRIERVYVVWTNLDLHSLDLQYYNRFISPKILCKKNVYNIFLWQKEEDI